MRVCGMPKKVLKSNPKLPVIQGSHFLSFYRSLRSPFGEIVRGKRTRERTGQGKPVQRIGQVFFGVLKYV